MNTENNKIIAIFMNNAIVDSNNNHKDTYNYHKDWNWLMEVVEKIEETEIENNILMLESIGNEAKFIFDDGCRFLNSNIGETKKEAVYNACVEFIKWYNNQNSAKETETKN